MVLVSDELRSVSFLTDDAARWRLATKTNCTHCRLTRTHITHSVMK